MRRARLEGRATRGELLGTPHVARVLRDTTILPLSLIFRPNYTQLAVYGRAPSGVRHSKRLKLIKQKA